MQKKKVCCFGEMLWDVVLDGKHAGGAPLNVAYHLAKFGSDVSIISKVGADSDGFELQRLVKSWNINPSLIGVDNTYKTGEVNAVLLENGEVEYDIKQPVAWDYIESNVQLKERVRAADCFVYGSLSARSIRSRETLLTLLNEAKFKVFDVNLRFPHYEADTVKLLLRHADVLKLNTWELIEVPRLLGLHPSSAEEGHLVEILMNNFAVRHIVVTKGKDGAAFYSADRIIQQASQAVVKVEDTIGCGDAFLAAFIASYLHCESLEITLKKAVGIGAFIATKSGGCPPYDLSEYEDFYNTYFRN